MKYYPLALLVLSILCSCRKHSQPAAVDSVHAGPTAISIQVLHTDSTQANDSTNRFGQHDTIHARIHTDNAKDSSTLSGQWYFITGNHGLATNTAQLGAGPNDTHFDLINAKPWPPGQYALIVDVNKSVWDTAYFLIGDAPKNNDSAPKK